VAVLETLMCQLASGLHRDRLRRPARPAAEPVVVARGATEIGGSSARHAR
jgi:hypothetical protein